MTATDRKAPAGLTGRQIAAVAAGNGLEFYDFVTYSFFAVQIGESLFPGGGHDRLLLSLGTFGIGFVTRPLGGLVIGRFADRRGRRPAMLLSFALMGAALIGLALTPPYAAIGLAAPALAIAFRMIQGFALGGDVGPTTAFLVEAAPPHRRGLYVSLQYATADAAVLVSGLVGLALSSALSAPQLTAWGWRAAFLLGATIVPFTLAARRRLVETLPGHAAQAPVPGQPRLSVIAFAGLLVVAGGTIANYTLDYLTTFAQTTLHMAVHTAFGATVVLGGASVAADLASGWLSDRYGRKRALTVPWALLVLLAVPCFLLITAWRDATALFAMTAVMAVLLNLGLGPAVTLFTESLPAQARAGAMGLVYAVAVALFGGSAQLVDHLLIGWTGSPLAPAWYMTAALAIGYAGLGLLRETRPRGRAVAEGAWPALG